MEYKSWIPTVPLRLSFSEIGNTGFPSRCKTINQAIGLERFIVSYQSRFLNDSALPTSRSIKDAVASIRKRWAGKFRFYVFSASQDYHGTALERIVGKVFLAPNYHYKDKLVFRYQFQRIERAIEQKCSADHVATLISCAVSSMESFTYASAEFTLLRNGNVTFNKVTLNPSLVNCQDLQEVASQKDILAEQMFFFLKDICHRHQHHHPSTDTVVCLHRLIEGYDDVSWRREVLYALFRKVIQYKRKIKEERLFNSLGILAYTRSFYESCVSDIKQSAKSLPKWNFEAVTLAVDSAQNLKNWRTTNQIRRSDSFRNFLIIFIAILGIFLSLFSILPSTVKESASFDGRVKDLLFFVIENIEISFAIILSFPVGYLIAANVNRWLSRGLFQDILRLLIALPKSVSSSILLLLSILVLYIGIQIWAGGKPNSCKWVMSQLDDNSLSLADLVFCWAM